MQEYWIEQMIDIIEFKQMYRKDEWNKKEMYFISFPWVQRQNSTILLNRFPDSNVFSKSAAGWRQEGGASDHQKLLYL